MTLSGRFTGRALEYLQELENLAMLDLKGARHGPAALSRFQRKNMLRLILFRGYEIDYAAQPRPQQRARRR